MVLRRDSHNNSVMRATGASSACGESQMDSVRFSTIDNCGNSTMKQYEFSLRENSAQKKPKLNLKKPVVTLSSQPSERASHKASRETLYSPLAKEFLPTKRECEFLEKLKE